MAADRIGQWEGGRITRGEEGSEVYHLEAMRRGVRYSISLGALTPKQAESQLALFNADPVAYKRTHDAKRAPLETGEGLVATPEIIKAYGSYLREQKFTPGYVKQTLVYLKAWFGPLRGRDLRQVELHELHAALDKFPTSKRKRIIALKSFTAFLRERGFLLLADDPTADLQTPQPRKPTAVERAEKTHTVEQLETTYKRLHLQHYRDAFRVRACTGLHLSELERIARGDCVLRELDDAGEIAGTVTFTHKNGRDHTLSLDAACLAACKRLRAFGTLGDLESFRLAEAVRFDEIEPVMLAHMRHTFVTLATTRGRLVMPPQGGVPLDIVMQTVGHTSLATTRGFYLGTHVPPMIVLPLELVHPDDPPLPVRRKAKKARAKKEPRP